MAYTKDALATMLLTMALLANREEYVRPYGARSFAASSSARASAGCRAWATSSARTSAG